MTQTTPDATLRARVRAAVDSVWGMKPLNAWELNMTERITTEVLAAIPEPAPVVRSHKCSTGGVTITYTAGAGWDRPLYPGVRERLLQVIPAGASDDDLAACLALRDGPDAKDAQIAALKDEVERYRHEYEQACGTIAAMHAAAVGEVTGPKRGVVEDVRDVHAEVERLRTLIAALTQRAEAAERENAHYDIKVELAALKTKAGTPTCLHDWHSYSDTAGTHSRCLRCGMVPGLEAPPTPAEYPVIGACVVRQEGSVLSWSLSPSQSEKESVALDDARANGGTVYQLLRGEVVP